jgi:NitT/TauT family transport system permease protein
MAARDAGALAPAVPRPDAERSCAAATCCAAATVEQGPRPVAAPRPAPMPAKRGLAGRFNRKETWLSLVVLVLFVAGWEWGPVLLGIAPYNIPRLSLVIQEGYFLYQNSQLLYHAGITCFEVLVGFTLGCLLGAVIGYLLGMSPSTEIIASPYILALQIAPKVAFAPLFILWFGYNITPKILVAVLIVFFPILINVLTAVRTVDPALINLARSFKASRWQIFWKIEFPASMPSLFSGLRIGSTLAVIGVTVGEFVGGNTGLGYLLVQGEGQGNTGSVFASIILLTLIGIIAYALVILAERRVLRYLPKRDFGDVQMNI